MGYEAIIGAKVILLNDLSAGWFPGKDHNEVPGSLTESNTPVGATEANNVIWYEDALRKIFGTSQITNLTLGASDTVQSIHYSSVLGKTIGNVKSKIYYDLETASPTDATASLTIADVPMYWTDWQWETNKYAIGVDGTNAPIKWTGSGNAAVLGGSPPIGKYVARFRDAIWIASTSAEPSTVFFSNIGEPEAWTANDDYKMDAPITGMASFGDQLVVFFEDHIGILTGTNNRLLNKIDRYVQGVGCTGGHTITAAKLKGKDVLIFHSAQGFFAYDGSKEVVPLSSPIRRKYISNSSSVRWNASRYDKAQAVYWPKFGWYVCTLSDGADTSNDFQIILDLNRVFEDKQGVFVPHWPIDGVTATSLQIVKSNNEDILVFGNNNGLVFKWDESLYTKAGSAYHAYYTSKTFDNVNSWILNEFNVLGAEQTSTISVYVRADLESAEGALSQISMSETATGLDAFVLDSSALAGRSFLLKNAPQNRWGRYIGFKLANSTSGEPMTINGLNLVVTETGVEENYTEVS